MTMTKEELKEIWARDHGFKDWDDLIDQTEKREIVAICDQINEEYLAQRINKSRVVVFESASRSGKMNAMMKIILAGGAEFPFATCSIFPDDEPGIRKHPIEFPTMRIDPLKWPEPKPLIQAEEIRGVIPDKYYKKKY